MRRGVATHTAVAIGLGALTFLGTRFRGDGFALRPDSRGWIHVVRGAPDGAFGARVVVLLPGLNRENARVLHIRSNATTPTTAEYSVDGDAAQWTRLYRDDLIVIPPQATPGARVDLRAPPVPIRLLSIQLDKEDGRASRVPLLAAIGVMALFLVLCLRWPMRVAGATSAAGAAAVIFLTTPVLTYWTWPHDGSGISLLSVLGLVLMAIVLGTPRIHRIDSARGAAFALAAVFGIWVRVVFLPSAGSWDTEYWKAWMRQSLRQGVTHVYGDRDAVPPGHWMAQLRGREPLWQMQDRDRSFVVDYPPLAMGLWKLSGTLLHRSKLHLTGAEQENIAVKLPAVIGDILAVLVLIGCRRGSWVRAGTLAALYWALPLSWLSSAVLGYLDGAYAPLLALAVWMAGTRRAHRAGAALALACLIKPTGIVVVSAILVALLPRLLAWLKATVTGSLIVVAVLVPFAMEGTLLTAFVHGARIFFQNTLSGGFANPWWLLGHLLHVIRDGAALAGPVQFAQVSLLAWPARRVGIALFMAAAGFVAFHHRRVYGPRAAALAAATLFFSYAILGVGVHENHPHPLFLLMFLTGLPSARLRVLTALAGSAYVVNMLMLSGLGRFYGDRFLALEPFVRSVAAARMAAGFDLTLLLAVIQSALFLWLLWGLRGEMATLEETDESVTHRT